VTLNRKSFIPFISVSDRCRVPWRTCRRAGCARAPGQGHSAGWQSSCPCRHEALYGPCVPACFLNVNLCENVFRSQEGRCSRKRLLQPPLSLPVTGITVSPCRRDSHWQSSPSHLPSLQGCLLQAAEQACSTAAMLKKMPRTTYLTL